MDKFRNKIFCGDSYSVLKSFPSGLVDCVITSPPYWALRDYGITPQIWDGDQQCKHEWDLRNLKDPMDRGGHGDHDSLKGIAGRWQMKSHQSGFCFKCEAWHGSLGLEPTFNLFIKHLCDIFDEVKRVSKDEGTCWVNLGDTYASTSSGNYPQKSLCMIPFRFAIEMVNRGWILRNTIIWRKPNCMPSSAKDRFTVDFEYVFYFVKSKKYWFDPQYEALKQSSIERLQHNFNYNKGDIASAVKTSGIKRFQERFLNNEVFGRNKRCVWTITTKPFKEAHFATYPPELCEIPIKSGCPEFVCKKCGKARKKIFNTTTTYLPYKHPAGKQPGKIYSVNAPRWKSKSDFVGYTDCGCNAGFSSGIVLDPFSGAGTSLLVAKQLGRSYLGIDLNPKYIEMAIKRIQSISDTNKNRKE
jgi:site-specific DNA-methyltransferase (adenine-specific)